MENRKGFADKYFLEKISLSGYKSILQTEIELKNNLSIIIGKNGSGKTNFLEFLDRIINDDVSKLYEFKGTLNFTGQKRIEIITEKKKPENTLNQKVFSVNDELRFTVQVDEEVTSYKMSEYDNMIQDGYGITAKSSTLIYHGVPSDYKFVSTPGEIVANTGEWPGSQQATFFTKQPYLVHGLRSSFFFSDIQFNEDSRFQQLTLQSVKQHLANTIFKEIQRLSYFLSEVSPISDIRFSQNTNIYKNNETGVFRIENLFLEFEVNNEWYSFNNLSDGTKRLFYIISEVAFTNEYFYRSLSFGESKEEYNSRIILIEEPELGIHPHQLHKLMLFLKEQSRSRQIIITTHSPEVLNILEPDELDSIILCYYDKEEGTQLRHLTEKEKKKGKAYMKEDFLSDYWLHSNLEPANERLMKIGLVGEAPGDTNAIINLLSRQLFFNNIQFCTLLQKIIGSQLDNQKTKRLLRIEYETEKPDIVIFIRDPDGLEHDKKAKRKCQKYFADSNRIVNKSGIYLLNIFELEALIIADLKTFNHHFGSILQYDADPMLLPNPRAFLKTGYRKYYETHNPELFRLLVYENLLDNCRYFRTFIQKLIAQINILS